MKKIMFNDRYGLTEAVLQGRKTMTRRVIDGAKLHWLQMQYGNNTLDWLRHVPYIPNTNVAVAQSYKTIYCFEPYQRLTEEYSQWFLRQKGLTGSKGWKNKMFVKAEFMPHQIRITDARVERLQDISDEDCMNEGIEEHLKGVQYGYPAVVWCGQFPFSTPKAAYAALIDKISGKGTWERNDYVWVYDFELIK
ncbi:MAG: hypothetical protein J5651_00430 [Salinivirgaceae bacterium]|nr:hypothetical protein [Salinivirgaceae bacterium]